MTTKYCFLHRSFLVFGLTIALWLSSACTAMVPVAVETTGSSDPEVEAQAAPVGYVVTGDAAGITAPEELPTGIVPITFHNTGDTPTIYLMGRLNEGLTFDQFMAGMAESPDAILVLMTLLGGGVFGPGESEITFDLKPGTHVVAAMGEGAPAVVALEVREGENPNTTPAPVGDIVVNLVDFSFVMPDEIKTGPQLWEITNTGTQPHEFNIISVEPGTTLAQLMDMMQAFMNPDGPPAPGVFFWPPVGPGERAWVEVDLAPGTYGMGCFLPDFAAEDMAHAESHLDLGMVRLLTVTE